MNHERHETHERGQKLLLREESYRLLGACFEVYKNKGCGFLEPVYQECLAMEFELQGTPAIAKPSLELEYTGRKLTQTYVPDFVCFGQIILELKASSHLSEQHFTQVLNYMRSTGMRLGILTNFGHFPGLEHRRVTAHDKWDDAPADFHA